MPTVADLVGSEHSSTERRVGHVRRQQFECLDRAVLVLRANPAGGDHDAVAILCQACHATGNRTLVVTGDATEGHLVVRRTEHLGDRFEVRVVDPAVIHLWAGGHHRNPPGDVRAQVRVQRGRRSQHTFHLFGRRAQHAQHPAAVQRGVLGQLHPGHFRHRTQQVVAAPEDRLQRHPRRQHVEHHVVVAHISDEHLMRLQRQRRCRSLRQVGQEHVDERDPHEPQLGLVEQVEIRHERTPLL